MKMRTLVLMTLLTTSSFANTDKSQTDKFSLRKEKMISSIDERIESLQTTKACYQKAQDEKALKSCREEIKKQMKKNRANRQEKKATKQQKRKEKQ
jgi:hypothetical protein